VANVANAEVDAAAVMTAAEGTADVEAVDAAKAEAAKVAEAEGCIGGGGMHRKGRNVSEMHGGGQS
jgi:hypothetical protein